MLFNRRIPADWREKLRIALWPRRSWLRSGKYILKRILRLSGSPHAVAAGVAAGVFASFTPFMGFHFFLGGVLAYLIAGNVLASAMGTFFGNPISFPFIWATTLTTGNFILDRGPAERADGFSSSFSFSQLWVDRGSTIAEHLGHFWEPVLKPMLVGSITVGVPIAIAVYIVTRWLAIQFRDRRRKKLSDKAEAIRLATQNRLAEKMPRSTAASQ